MRISDWSSDVCSSDLHEPEILVRALRLPEDEIWRCHQAAKSGLVARVKSLTGVSLDPAAPILGFARRMTSYKRPMLIFSDLDRRARVASRSEEHKSELQSLMRISYAACCVKKKNTEESMTKRQYTSTC